MSREGLSIFNEYLGPEYERIRRDLHERLGVVGLDLTSLVDKDKNDRANLEFLKSFIKNLPAADKQNHEAKIKFSETEPYLIRAIGLNIVWAYSVSSYSHDAHYLAPYYVIGSKKRMKHGKRLETSELLLIGAIKEDSNIIPKDLANRVMKLPVANRHGRKIISQLSELKNDNYPNADEIKQMFSPESHSFILSPSSPRSVKVENYFDPIGARNTGVMPLSHITDAEIAEFSVNQHLHELAVQFGKASELDELLQNIDGES